MVIALNNFNYYFDKCSHVQSYVMMKLSDYAKNSGISHRTAWKYFKQGKLDAHQTHTGTIIKKNMGKSAYWLNYYVKRLK